VNKDHFYRGTFTTYILHIIYSAVHYSGSLYVYYRDGGMGTLEAERERGREGEGGRRRGVVGRRGSCESKLSFYYFFFFNHSTVCSIKVKPIERESATFSQLLLGEPTGS